MLLVGCRGNATFKSPFVLASAFAFVDDGDSSRSNIIDCHGKIKVYRHGGINSEGLLTHFFLYSIPNAQGYLMLTGLREHYITRVSLIGAAGNAALESPFIFVCPVTFVF
ncbi:hypothetical protein IX324_002945 [Bacteroides pyogenes]|nr:hypothetical protein [Bacteroides pyogenes]